MDKIIKTIIVSSLISFSFADYTLIYPMEMSKGGFLPDGSIIISEKQVAEPQIPVKPPIPYTCEISSTYRWRTVNSTQESTIIWDGQTVGMVNNQTSFITEDQIKYSRGNVFQVIPAVTVYEICRQSIY